MRRMFGNLGEDQAVLLLQKKGFEILMRNWRCKVGEIDIVAWQEATLVLVEVKTRVVSLQASQSRGRFDPARIYLFDSINRRKISKLRILSEIYLRKHYRKTRPPVRIDVVGVLIDKESGRVIRTQHIVGAV